ncbi:MAG: neutral ceramidase [Verrucomicrobiales bacterium]
MAHVVEKITPPYHFEADHPGVIAMFLNGCSGDQNPYPRRLVPLVERHGRSMATAIEAALETTPTPLAGPLKSAIAWPEVAYAEPPTRE